MKIIAIIGGGCSEIGKSYISASIGYLLKENGMNVDIVKFDGYLNLHTGIMCKYHKKQLYKAFKEEVFVLSDGTETDSDLGIYERFLEKDLSYRNYLTNGKLLLNLITQDKGNGKILTFTDLKELYLQHILSFDCNVLIIEVGGTIGDPENKLFLEALAELSYLEDIFFVLVAPLFPLHQTENSLPSSFTKLIRNSYNFLLQMGIKPGLIVARINKEINLELMKRTKQFLETVLKTPVIILPFLNNVYEIPLYLLKCGILKYFSKFFKTSFVNRANNYKLFRLIAKFRKPKIGIKINIIDWMESYGPFVSLIDSLTFSSAYLGMKVSFTSEIRETDGIILLNDYENLKIKRIYLKKARKNNIPVLATGGGFYFLVDEFVSSELNERPLTKHGKIKLGSSLTLLRKDSRLERIYSKEKIIRRHRHTEYIDNYEKLFNTELAPSAFSSEGHLEGVELQEHPFYIGVAFSPEYTSKPFKVDDLYINFILTIKNLKKEKNKN